MAEETALVVRDGVKDVRNMKALSSGETVPVLTPGQALVNADQDFINPATSEDVAALTAAIEGGITVGGSVVVSNLPSTQTVVPAGSTGTDQSVNRPALPNIGANFAAGAYGGYVLVKTIAANPNRRYIEIANLTGAQIAVLRDDGTAASGQSPANASVFALAGGAGIGQQGGGWSSSTFRGRLQIFAPAALTGNATITVMED